MSNKDVGSGIDLEAAENLASLFATLPNLNKKKQAVCKKRIKAILKSPSTNTIGVFCRWLFNQERLDSFVEDCILSVVGHLEKPSEDLPKLDGVLYYRLVNASLLNKIAILVSEKYGPKNVLLMEHCLSGLYRKNKDELIKLTLSFILHPKGKYRETGRDLWDNYHLESSDFDPLTLDENMQIVFAMFMLQDWGNPETRLPKVLSLFLSTSEKVKQALMTQMQEYTDNYMGHVTHAIDILGLDTKETRQIKQYVDERYQAIKCRRGLKELSPLYYCYDVYKEVLRTSKEFQLERMKDIEANSKPAWMDMFKKQTLARGGGWRFKDGKTQHLAKIEVSFPSKIMVQSMTPMEQEKWLTDLNKDWDVAQRDC